MREHRVDCLGATVSAISGREPGVLLDQEWPGRVSVRLRGIDAPQAGGLPRNHERSDQSRAFDEPGDDMWGSPRHEVVDQQALWLTGSDQELNVDGLAPGRVPGGLGQMLSGCRQARPGRPEPGSCDPATSGRSGGSEEGGRGEPSGVGANVLAVGQQHRVPSVVPDLEAAVCAAQHGNTRSQASRLLVSHAEPGCRSARHEANGYPQHWDSTLGPDRGGPTPAMVCFGESPTGLLRLCRESG